VFQNGNERESHFGMSPEYDSFQDNGAY